MKTKTILFCAAALLAPLFSQAADADHPPGPPPAGERGHGDRPSRGEMRDELKRMAEELDLTDAQKSQVRDILKARRDAMKDLSREERWGPKGQAIREESNQKIRALLTPEQQKKFDAMVAEMKERFGKGGPRGDRPPPPRD